MSNFCVQVISSRLLFIAEEHYTQQIAELELKLTYLVKTTIYIHYQVFTYMERCFAYFFLCFRNARKRSSVKRQVLNHIAEIKSHTT